MTRAGGVVIGVVIAAFSLLTLKLEHAATVQQQNLLAFVYVTTTIICVGGIVLGLGSLFRNKNLLGTTFRDGFVFGFSGLFELVGLVVLLASGQPLLAL